MSTGFQARLSCSVWGLMLLAHCSANAQGTFQNLDVESAQIVSAGSQDPSVVQFAPAFPGWSGYVGTNGTGVALYNSAYLDDSGFSIIDQGWHLFGPPGPLAGNFSLLLQGGVAPGTLNPVSATMSQTGLVPANSQSLQFKAWYSTPFPPLSITLGGRPLPLTVLSSSTSYTLLGADVRSLAGQVAELDLTVFTTQPHTANIDVFLDDIVFSATTIPEPGTFAIIAAGGAFALLLSGTRGRA